MFAPPKQWSDIGHHYRTATFLLVPVRTVFPVVKTCYIKRLVKLSGHLYHQPTTQGHSQSVGFALPHEHWWIAITSAWAAMEKLMQKEKFVTTPAFLTLATDATSGASR